MTFRTPECEELINRATFDMFLQEVFQGYTLHRASYHNEIHGLDVMQMCYIILNSGLSQVANLN